MMVWNDEYIIEMQEEYCDPDDYEDVEDEDEDEEEEESEFDEEACEETFTYDCCLNAVATSLKPYYWSGKMCT